MKATSTRPDVQRYINSTLVSLAVVYPFVTHFFAVGEQVWPSLVLIYAILCLLILEASLRKNIYLFIPAVICLALAILFAESGQLLLNLYPIVITGSLFVVFIRTLARGKIPIITLFAVAIEKDLSARKIHYTRKITQLWSMLFLAMFIESILLAVYAAPSTWSLFTNFVNYLLIGCVFVLEYVFRKYYFRQETHAGFVEFINQIRKLRISHVLQQKKS